LTSKIQRSPGRAKRNGRPTKYDTAFAAIAQRLAARGHIDRDIAEILGVSERTLHAWKKRHPRLSAALKAGKAVADDRVQMALYNRAVGYNFDTEKVFHDRGEIVRAPFVEHVPPNIQACIFWLINRRPKAWRKSFDGSARDIPSDAPGVVHIVNLSGERVARVPNHPVTYPDPPALK
jgi:hypothetical protein